jgi:hypothetical protein
METLLRPTFSASLLALCFVLASASPACALPANVDLSAIVTTAPTPASDVSPIGMFYSALHPNRSPAPANFDALPVWDIGNGAYLLDDLDGDQDTRGSRFGGMQNGVVRDDDTPPTPDGGDGGGSGGGAPQIPIPSYGSNDLWLEITGYSNAITYLTIHSPVTNGIYGLYYQTNLLDFYWSWVLRCAPGQTNLIVTNNLSTNQCFFILGPPTAIRPGFNEESLGPSDDDYTGTGEDGMLLTNLLADIGFTINFFGTNETNLYVNNNGNVTFGGFLSDFTPIPLAELGTNIIAPFWADVDTRGVDSSVVTYGWGAVHGRNAFGVNWVNVGYFDQASDKLDSFQLILEDRSDRDMGDFDAEFNYAQIEWDAGDVSGGIDGLWTPDQGGCAARAGYATATGTAFELNGSATQGGFLDTNHVTGLIYNNYISTVPGRYVFQFHAGAPLSNP